MTATTLSFWVYTLLITGIGVYSTRYGRTSSADFFLANRGIGAWVAALSSSASAESGWAGLGAAFGPAIILILLWRRTSATGVIAGMAVGFITAIVWRETLHDYLYELVPAFLLAFVTILITSVAYPDKD